MTDRDGRPQQGDVLIIQTTKSFKTFAVGRVMKDGQQSFSGQEGISYVPNLTEAIATAKTLCGRLSRVYLLNLDTNVQIEIPGGRHDH